MLVVYLKSACKVNTQGDGEKLSIWKAFLLIPQKPTPLVAQGWTLVHELYFYLIFALLLRVRQSWVPAALLTWGALVAALSFPLVQKSPELEHSRQPADHRVYRRVLCRDGGPAADTVRGGGWALAVGVVLLVLGGMRLTDLTSPWQRVGFYGVPSAADRLRAPWQS